MTRVRDDDVRKLADNMAYPPRALRAERAAAYLSMSTSRFLRMVADHELPEPVRMHGMVMWDRLELDEAFERWKEKQRKARKNTFAAALGIEDDEDDVD